MSTLAITHNPSFYERVVLDMLSRMDKGRLDVTLPDGHTVSLGSGEGNIRAEMSINDNDFFRRCVLYGDVGFGESYSEGIWETSSITNVIKWFLLNIDNAPNLSGSEAKTAVLGALRFFNKISHARRSNTVSKAKKNISKHYDLSNEFFSLWLDPSMTYSSAYFKTPELSLEEAQHEKYDRLSRLMRLKPEHHVLEIGSGWGGNAIHMASNYGCKVTSITISEEQQKLATEKVKAAGLSDKIKIVLEDYRIIEGQYDRIVSIEMLEAVGAKYYDNYFRQVHRLLKQDGLVALQVITCPDSRFEELRRGVDWIQKHIFPGSLLPSVGAMNKAINNTGDLTLIDLKDLGQHYARTLAIWRDNFNRVKDKVENIGFDESFQRKWNYYLSYCEAAFAMRNINVMQLLYSRPNNLHY
ncbi:MAG: cyclopropane-fatty-acyl-phospholipid synthase family protein [Bacteroidota bacterium]|nr:cyclopropane-fatty-acyl-phospholipid synthase family protein [Bacteroidota bacterium]